MSAKEIEEMENYQKKFTMHSRTTRLLARLEQEVEDDGVQICKEIFNIDLP